MAPNLISLTQLLAGQNEGDIIGREILATQSPLLGSVKGPPPPPPPLGQDSRPLVLPLAAAAAGRFLCPNSTTEGFPSPSSCCNLLGVACRQIPMESFKQENGADGLGRGQSFPSQPLLTPGPVGQTGQAGRLAGRPAGSAQHRLGLCFCIHLQFAQFINGPSLIQRMINSSQLHPGAHHGPCSGTCCFTMLQSSVSHSEATQPA